MLHQTMHVAIKSVDVIRRDYIIYSFRKVSEIAATEEQFVARRG